MLGLVAITLELTRDCDAATLYPMDSINVCGGSMGIIEQIMVAFWAGISEDAICRIFDLPHFVVEEIIIHN